MVLQQRVQLGEFILCPVNQHLEIGAERIPLEPKVYQVLCYLISQQQRFVSLEELHQQVWAGRVVSDTAVRRSISKLRAAFLDQQEPARYIQSAAKRGYRWLVPAEPVATAVIAEPAATLTAGAEPHDQPQPATSNAVKPEQSTSQRINITRTGHRHKVWRLWRWLLLLLPLPLLWQYWQQQPFWHWQTALAVVEGEKLSMDLNPDQSQLIFTSNAANHIGQEIYHYHRRSGVLQQLTSGDNHIMHAAFAKDGKSLFYHNYKNNHYELFQQDINASGQLTGPARVLLSGYDVMLDIQPQPDQQSLLLNLGSKNGKAEQSQIQRLDLRSGALTAVTSSMIAGVHDTAFAVSADQQRLVFQRIIPGQQAMLMVQDLTKGTVLQQLSYPSRIFDLHWLSEQRVLILDEEAFAIFDLATQKRQPVETNTLPDQVSGKGLSRTLLPLAEQQWLAFRHSGDLSKMLFQQGNIGALTERTLIHTPAFSKNIYFAQQPKQLFLHLQQDDVQQFLLQQPDGQQQLLFEVKGQQLQFQQQHPDGSNLLLLLDGKPQLFDLSTHQLKPLDLAGNQWQSGYFMPDGHSLLLTSKTHGQYQTWLYQLQTAQSRLLLQGYSQVIPYLPGQFVALKPDLSFVLLKDGAETTLNVRMQPPFPGSVHLRQQQLFWGETDLKTSRICRYQLQQQQQQCWQQDRRQLLQRFDVSNDGKRWLLRHLATIDTKIVPVNTNLK